VAEGFWRVPSASKRRNGAPSPTCSETEEKPKDGRPFPSLVRFGARTILPTAAVEV
jgi:hypothetical protein